MAAGRVGGGAARAVVDTAGVGRGAGGARIPEPALAPALPPLPNGLKSKHSKQKNQNFVTYCPSRAATGS